MSHAGITSAADIDHQVFRVPGIGSTRFSALLNWRTRLEAQAQHAAPARLPRHEAAAIEYKFATDRQALENEKQRLRAQLTSKANSIRQRAAMARQSLGLEEQRAKNQCAQEQSALRQSHETQVAALKRKLAHARGQAAAPIAELSEKLRVAQKHIFALHWRSAKQEREQQRFASLRFQDYLKSVLGL